jgi:hypothetical protein
MRQVIPVTARGGPYVYETSRLPHILDNRLTNGDELVSLTRRPATIYPPRIFLPLISVRG